MDNDFRFVLHETPLDSYLAKSGPHKYISKKMVRGKWVYEYKDDVVKRVVDLLLDFLSNPARSATLGQVARSFRVNNVMAKEVVDSLVAQKRIELVPGERGVPTYRQATPKEAKPKPVVREPVASKEKEKKASFARYQDQVMERLKAEPDGWLYYRGATRDLPLDGYEANKLIDALVERGLVTKDSKTWSSGTTETRIHLTAKGRGKKEEPKEPPKVLIEPPKKTKKELQAQKKELQREANKVHGAGGQLSLDFTVKLEMIDDKISDADINENAEKVVEEIQKPEPVKEPEVIKVDGKKENEFTKEIGDHVWGSRADRWASLNSADDLKGMTPSQQSKLCVKSKIMPKTTPEQLLDQGNTPGCVLLRNAVEKCVQAKAGDSLRARELYVEGITFLSRSLDACETEQDVRDFLLDWHQMSRGFKTMAKYSDAEMDRMKFDYAERTGLVDVTYEEFTYAKEALTALRDQEREIRLTLRAAHMVKDTKAFAVAKVKLDAIEDENLKARKRFDAIGGNRVDYASVIEVVASAQGMLRSNLSYQTDVNGNFVFYEADPNLSGDVRDNKYAQYGAALGTNMIKLMGTSAPTYRGPKAYRDAHNKVRGWEVQQLSEEDRVKEMFDQLQPGKRGQGKKAKPKWERVVPDTVEREGGLTVKQPVTVEQFAKEFGFANVQMGNWVKSDLESAKSHLDGAHGALLDLSDLMGIDTKTISLNGRLAIAFGGRGSGSARAHYEPTGQIINVTKVAGGGSLAHEWAHAIDNIMCVAHNPKGTKGMPMISDGDYEGIPEKIQDAYHEVMTAIRFQGYTEKDGYSKADIKLLAEGAALEKKVTRERKCTLEERSKIWKYRALKRNMTPSKFYKGALDLGGSKSTYWTRNHEMFARAFESYIEDTLEQSGRKSSYLVSGTKSPRAYPEGEERKRINEAMAKLVRALAEEKALEKSLRLLDEQFFIKAG